MDDVNMTSAGGAPLFWRVMRKLIIIHTAILAALMLFVVADGGIGGLFQISMLREVEDVYSFFVWLWNGGTIGTVLLALSSLAWAVVWHRATGRPARRLEWWYAVGATAWFAISAGVVLVFIAYEFIQGNTYIAMDGLQEGGGFVAITNAHAMIIGAYALWSRRRR